MNLGGRVRLARKRRKLTQEKLVELTNGAVSQARLSALEKRDSKRSDALYQLAQALDVNPQWLQDGKEPSGLEKPAAAQRDRILEQLIDLYGQLSEQHRHELVGYANALHAQEHPLASTSNPFGKKREPAQPKQP